MFKVMFHPLLLSPVVIPVPLITLPVPSVSQELCAWHWGHLVATVQQCNYQCMQITCSSSFLCFCCQLYILGKEFEVVHSKAIVT